MASTADLSDSIIAVASVVHAACGPVPAGMLPPSYHSFFDGSNDDALTKASAAAFASIYSSVLWAMPSFEAAGPRAYTLPEAVTALQRYTFSSISPPNIVLFSWLALKGAMFCMLWSRCKSQAAAVSQQLRFTSASPEPCQLPVVRLDVGPSPSSAIFVDLTGLPCRQVRYVLPK